MRIYWTHKELGEPLILSDDDVTNFMLKEALVARAAKEKADEEKRQKREEWKRDPAFKNG